MCPAVPNLMCFRSAGGVPFHYVKEVRLNPSTKLVEVTKKTAPSEQRYTPAVRDALTKFVSDMAKFNLPLQAILTAGSWVCRCKKIDGQPTASLSNHALGDAFDVTGVQWQGTPPGGSPVTETIVHNWTNAGQRDLLRRINACLRLSFQTVIDYHRSD